MKIRWCDTFTTIPDDLVGPFSPSSAAHTFPAVVHQVASVDTFVHGHLKSCSALLVLTQTRGTAFDAERLCNCVE